MAAPTWDDVAQELGLPNTNASLALVLGGASLDQGATSDQEYLQGLINAQITAGNKKVFLPSGTFTLTDTLNFLPGDTFRGIEIVGAGSSYRGGGSFPGTILDATGFSDRPAVKIAGARMVRVRGIGLKGANFDHVSDNGLGSTSPELDDTDVSNWLGDGLDEGAAAQNGPYQGIAIDPTVGESYSSDVTLWDVWVAGFVVGVGIQCADHDGNGDFVSVRDSLIEMNVYSVAAGNTQGRCFAAYNSRFMKCYTAIDGQTFGRQNGRFGGTFVDCVFDGAVNLLNIATSRNGPAVFSNCYGEVMYSLGRAGGNNTNNNALIFTGCEFHLAESQSWRGVPKLHLDHATGGAIFTGSYIKTHGGFAANCVVRSDMTRWDGARLDTTDGGSDDVTTVHASRWACGGILSDLMPGSTIKAKDVRVGATGTGGYHGDLPVSAGYRFPIMKTVRRPHQSEANARVHQGPVRDGTYRVPYSKGDLTFTSASDPKAVVVDVSGVSAPQYGISKGDVAWDATEMVWFLVTGVAGDDVTMEALTGFAPTAGGYDWVDAYTTDSGTLYFYCTRHYATQYPIFGDITSGGTTIANAGRADGYSGAIDDVGGIRVGDYLEIDDFMFRPFAPGATVASINEGSGQIVMSSAAQYTQSRVPLLWWVRAPDVDS